MAIYNTLYDLINTYIFGGGVVAGTVQELAVVLFSLAGSLFCIAVPFIVVFVAIKFIFGR